MAIRSAANLYPGINPHLNSALQQRGGGWKSFHTASLLYLFDLPDSTLPPEYSVRPEDSIQVKVYDFHPSTERGSRSEPDILITKMPSAQETVSTASSRSTPTMILPITRVIEEMDEMTALVIYKGEKPITRIELLSPANKSPNAYHEIYTAKRADSLYSGLRFVEIDYLHETRPTIDLLPSYPDKEDKACPYRIIVMDPRPIFEEGTTAFYEFGVMDAIPIIDIPLDGEDTVRVDFGAVYNQTYGKRTFYREVDYTQLPVNFDAYSEADQQAIRDHMAAIAANPPPETTQG